MMKTDDELREELQQHGEEDEMDDDFDIDVQAVKEEAVKFDDIVSNTNTAWKQHAADAPPPLPAAGSTPFLHDAAPLPTEPTMSDGLDATTPSFVPSGAQQPPHYMSSQPAVAAAAAVVATTLSPFPLGNTPTAPGVGGLTQQAAVLLPQQQPGAGQPVQRKKQVLSPEVNERLLLGSYTNIVTPKDSERPWQPSGRPYKTPHYYPQQQLASLGVPELFRRLDNDSLFFAFYYQQNTYQQYLAARQLKLASWRYHKQLNQWFQRKSSPTENTDDYEMGSYFCFDYNTWTNAEKDEFRFEYTHLEDEVPPAVQPRASAQQQQQQQQQAQAQAAQRTAPPQQQQ